MAENPLDFERCPTCFAPLREGQACTDPHCLYDAAERGMNDLAVGTVLNDQFRIGRVLGRGGFGITYLAWDERLERRAAVKECFPQGLVRRSRDGISVLAINDDKTRQFTHVRDLFLREARVLAHFHDQPGIVSVLSILDTKGSAYLVMEFLSGQTLKAFLESQPDQRIPFDHALRLLRPVIDALTAVHDQNYLHRDVSPDNIFITDRGLMKLLDFGAARHAAGQQTKSLPVILKEGYAPSEQYSAKGQQGTWTDVYALSATFYRAIAGETPPPALDRLEGDDIVPPSRIGIDIPPAAEVALLEGLAVRWQNRIQTVGELGERLFQASGVAVAPPAPVDLDGVEPPPPIPPPMPPWEPVVVDEPSPWQQRESDPLDPLEDAPVIPDIISEPEVLPPPNAEDVARPRRWYAIALPVAAALALMAGAAWFLIGDRGGAPITGSTGTLVIDAVPWARVERLVDASGAAQALPDPPATPLALEVPTGEYTLSLTGPPPGQERREVRLTVAAGQPNVTTMTFGEIRVEDYFREQRAMLASAQSRAPAVAPALQADSPGQR